ncbi:hypothetical protein ACQ4WX_07455 [Streptomyces lasalocidi]
MASYRCIPGHGPANAAALDEAGVAVWIQDPADLKGVLGELVGGPLGQRQREAGLALFAPGPADGPAAEIARLHHPGPPPPPPGPGRRRRLRTRRLAVTGAAACAVWACAVGTGVVTTYDGPALMHTLGHGLDLDRPAPAFTEEGHHS